MATDIRFKAKYYPTAYGGVLTLAAIVGWLILGRAQLLALASINALFTLYFLWRAVKSNTPSGHS